MKEINLENEEIAEEVDATSVSPEEIDIPEFIKRGRGKKSATKEPVVKKQGGKRVAPTEKSGKGKKTICALLIIGAIGASTIAAAYYGTQAYYTYKETQNINTLISAYQEAGVVILPETANTTRSYDVTYGDGNTLIECLDNNNVDCIKINGEYYTSDGRDIGIQTFVVTYRDEVPATEIKTDGNSIYIAPEGYTLNGTTAVRYRTEYIDRVISASGEYVVSFDGAYTFAEEGEVEVVSTKKISTLANSTLICDVPDNATLDENGLCEGTLTIAPKRH